MRGFFVGASILTGIAAIFFISLFAFFPIKHKDDIRAASKLYSVNKVLIASIINAESSFRTNAVSPKGATGLMQIMPTTADYIAVKLKLDDYDLFDARTNIMMGTYYFRYLLDKFNDTRTALFAYNAGEGNVTRWLSEKGATALTTSPYKETNAYVDKVLNARSFYRFRI